jgi:thiol-disulfide isomerase/thioredoxin
MKLKIIFLCFGIAVAMLSKAQGKSVETPKDTATVEVGISFKHEVWTEILKLAKAENKLIFVDCYTTWCGPCKKLAKTVFVDQKVGQLMNSKFINVKMDMEKEEGVDLGKKYDVKAYPTLLFINPNGDVEHRIVGGIPAEDFIKAANDALSGKGLAIYMKKFRNGVRDTAFLKKYIQIMSSAYLKEDAANATLELFKVAGMDYMLTSDGWEPFAMLINDPYSDPFLYLWDNLRLIKEKIGKENVDKKIESVCSAYGKLLTKKVGDKYEFGEARFIKFVELMKEKGVSNIEDVKFNALIDAYYKTGNWPSFVDLVDGHIKMGGKIISDKFQLYSYAMAISKNCADASIRLHAIMWVDLAIQKGADADSKEMLPKFAKLKVELQGAKK